MILNPQAPSMDVKEGHALALVDVVEPSLVTLRQKLLSSSNGTSYLPEAQRLRSRAAEVLFQGFSTVDVDVFCQRVEAFVGHEMFPAKELGMLTCTLVIQRRKGRSGICG